MDLIKSLRREFGLDIVVDDVQASSAIQHLTQNLEHACTNLSEDLYSRATHFILELIQNADDNTYPADVTPTLIMELGTNQFTTWCNEVGFTPQNVRAICSIGNSTKSSTVGYIGEKGIGFKSVFTVADIVRVWSGPYTFLFDKNQRLGMIAPVWIDNQSSPEGWTSFNLELSDKIKHEDLVARIHEIRPSLLLFLRKVHCIEIIVDERNLKFQKSVLDGVTEITRSVDNTELEKQEYLLYKHAFTSLPAEEKREGVLQSDIVLAFPIDEYGEPAEGEQEVHAFLPLRSYGFRFIIQADFLTASNREGILTHKKWNRALRDAIAPAIIQAIPLLQLRSSLVYTWIRYLRDSVTDDFFKPVCTTLLSSLQQIAILRDEDGVSRCPLDMLMLTPPYADRRTGGPLIPHTYLENKYYLALQYDVSRDRVIFRAMGVKDMSFDDLIAGIHRMALDGTLSERDDGWWEDICAALLELRYTSDREFKRIRGLKIVPLASGAWVSPLTDGIFFDSALADIPRDLNLRLIKPLNPQSSHYRLLQDLGVKDADYAKVTEKIVVLHWRFPHQLKRHTLPSHARFLFKHQRDTYNIALNYLKVVTAQDTIVPAPEVYMDHPKYSSLPLSNCLTGNTAPFLHSAYDEPFWSSATERKAWMDWLCGQLGVNISPKIGPLTLSPEFRVFLHSTNTTNFLEFLAEYADDMRPHLQTYPEALQELRTAYVDTVTGRQLLHTTYIARGALTHFKKLPFLPVHDPENLRWDCLRDFGVSFQVDGGLYLKELVRLSEQPLKPMAGFFDEVLGQVKIYYKQLEARFDDGDLGVSIRHAFAEKCLIYIPARDCGSSSHGRWTSWANSDVVWDGPPCMRSKYALSKVYSEYHTFFCDQLQVPPCPEHILSEEIQFLYNQFHDAPLDEDAHVHAHNILCDLEATFSAAQDWTEAWTPAWLQPLRWLPFIPSQTAVGEVRLKSILDNIYLPDLTGELAKLFIGQVPIVTTPPEASTNTNLTLRRLFGFPWVSGVHPLEEVVRQELLGASLGHLSLVTEWTNQYRSKVAYLGCLQDALIDKELCDSVQALMTQVQNIRIYEAPSDVVMHVFTLQNVSRIVSLPLGVEQAPDSCNVLVGKSCLEAQRDISICMELARMCPAVRATDLYTIFTQPPLVLNTLFPSAKDLKLTQLSDNEDPPATSSHNLRESHLEVQEAAATETSVSGEPQVDYSTDAAPGIFKSKDDYVATAAVQDLASHLQLVDWQHEQDQTDDAVPKLHTADPCVQNLLPRDTVSSTNRTQKLALKAGPADFKVSTNVSVTVTVPAFKDTPTLATLRFQPPMSAPSDEQEYAGIMGEIFVFKFCEKTLPGFTHDNWTSELRTQLHFPPYQEISLADFTYEDSQGTLTEQLFGTTRRNEWRDRWPTYYMEVKATAGQASEAFHFSASQLSTARKMELGQHGKQPPQRVYVLVRVSSVRSQPAVQMYPDPWRLLCDGRMRHASDVDMVIT